MTNLIQVGEINCETVHFAVRISPNSPLVAAGYKPEVSECQVTSGYTQSATIPNARFVDGVAFTADNTHLIVVYRHRERIMDKPVVNVYACPGLTLVESWQVDSSNLRRCT